MGKGRRAEREAGRRATLFDPEADLDVQLGGGKFGEALLTRDIDKLRGFLEAEAGARGITSESPFEDIQSFISDVRGSTFGREAQAEQLLGNVLQSSELFQGFQQETARRRVSALTPSRQSLFTVLGR